MYRGVVNKFNRGEVDVLSLTRDDVVKINNSSSLMENFMPVRTGPMKFRPGTQHLGTVIGEAHMAPFIAATDDVASVEFTNNLLRVWVDDALVTRAASTTTIANGTFNTDLASWTDGSGAGSTAVWQTGGYAALTGAGTTSAILSQTLTTTLSQDFALRFVILQAPVLVKIGTSGAGSEDVFRGTLGIGTHSLLITGQGSQVTVTLSNAARYKTLIDSVTVEASGVMTVPTSVVTTSLDLLRYTQSADILYVGVKGIPQFKVERRGARSWSVVEYQANDGPFEIINTTDITLAAGALNGDTTLTANSAFFTADHVGGLFKLGSSGQTVSANVSAEDNGTGSIRVTGVDSTRAFTISVSGTFVATVTLQRSSDDATWEDVETYTTLTNKSFNDTFDNSIFFYRLFVKSGDFTSDTVVLSLDYASGSIEGIARVTGFTSSTVVNCQVLTAFGDTDATRDWFEGSWSTDNGHPDAVELYEGRVWWAGKNKLWGSVSDAYTSFDRSIEGDSASILRTIGYGPVDSVSWLAESTRLIMGIASDEIAVRSSSFGEVLSPTNSNLKSGSNRGAAPINPLKIDDLVYFVQRSGIKIFGLAYNLGNDVHSADDLTVLHSNICKAGIKRIVRTREPETRIYAVLDDGEARVYMFDAAEDVAAWSRITAGNGGLIEDAMVLPGAIEDRVYFVVNRGGTRFFEKMALFSEAEGGSISKHFDCFVQYVSPGTTITGLSHLEGDTVTVWADGQNRGTFTVASGSITVPTAWTDVTVGLAYNADYISNKLNRYVAKSVLAQDKRVVNTAVILANYEPGALKIGPTAALRKALPGIENGTAVDQTATITNHDELPFEFDGEDETDPRIHMRATGPCTIAALTYDVYQKPKPKSRSDDEG